MKKETKKAVKPKKKVVKKKVENEVLAVVLEMLKISNPEAYAKVTQQEEEQIAREEAPSFEEYCEEMMQAVRQYVDHSKNHMILEVDMMHAILFKKVVHTVHKINSSNPMMPYEKDEEGTFCIVQVFYWDESVKENEFLSKLIWLGAEYHDVRVPEHIKERM
jgi:hypothetical protein